MNYKHLASKHTPWNLGGGGGFELESPNGWKFSGGGGGGIDYGNDHQMVFLFPLVAVYKSNQK